MFTDDSASGYLQPYPLAGQRAFGFDPFLANERLFSHLHAKAQAGLERVDRFIHFMSVERHPGFQTQGIACAQAAGNQPFRLSGFQQQVPELRGVLVREVDLVSMLAGIAGLGDQAVEPAYLPLPHKAVIFRRDILGRRELFQNRFGVRPL